MPKEPEHTPTPWRMSEEHGNLYRIIGPETFQVVAEVYDEADARLVAAAPKLAGALADVRELLIVLAGEEPDPLKDTAWAEEALPDVVQRASEALEEAAGEEWWKVLGEL